MFVSYLTFILQGLLLYLLVMNSLAATNEIYVVQKQFINY